MTRSLTGLLPPLLLSQFPSVCCSAAAGVVAGKSSADDGGIIRRYSDLDGEPYKVTYDGRSMRVKDKPVLLLSGSVHYPRSTPAMWPSIFAKMKASGLNAVESYVFWNFHVRTLADHNAKNYDYTGRGNVSLFLSLAAKNDMFVIWRIGPYICAEWPGGGYPSWLGQVDCGDQPKPCMHTRTATQPYMDVARTWMHDHIEHVRPYFAENGGPVIMTQMDNELSRPADGYLDYLYGLVGELKTNLPWIMCHGAHTNNTIETCNGCDCTNFVPGLVKQNQPAMWSEDEQWFDRFSQGASVRHTGDLGRSVAAFIAVGGSMHNFYMFHGGTMWGNWSTTTRRTRLTPSYANSANLASDSIVYNPKYQTIAALHHVLADHAATILHTPAPVAQAPIPAAAGDLAAKQWYVTHNGSAGDPPITFLFNDAANATDVAWAGTTRRMAPRSCVIVDGSGTQLWYSEPTEIDSVGEPYHDVEGTGSLAWTNWSSLSGAAPGSGGGGAGTWYRTTFRKPALPAGAQVSVNMTGFGQGNLFLNGVHVAYFDLTYGECFHAPGGVNDHGACLSYVVERCDRPTQDCYHVAPEWVAEGENELLVWSDARLPTNITSIDPSRLRVVYRVDPPDVQEELRRLV